MDFLNTILDLIFPLRCVLCKHNDTDLCYSCISKFEEASFGGPSWIFPVFNYKDKNVKKVLWFLKYKNKKNLAKILAEVLSDKINEELSDLIPLENFTKPILIPIPISPKRNKERGYNQSTLICDSLAKINKNLKTETRILLKTKDTKHQTEIKNRKEREQNIKNSFCIKNTDLVLGKNIILIDDITTTGATFTEARKILKQAGARKIIAFAVAH